MELATTLCHSAPKDKQREQHQERSEAFLMVDSDGDGDGSEAVLLSLATVERVCLVVWHLRFWIRLMLVVCMVV